MAMDMGQEIRAQNAQMKKMAGEAGKHWFFLLYFLAIKMLIQNATAKTIPLFLFSDFCKERVSEANQRQAKLLRD